MRYEVIFETSLNKLNMEVSERLRAGWELAGPFAVAVGGETTYDGYFQPMIYKK